MQLHVAWVHLVGLNETYYSQGLRHVGCDRLDVVETEICKQGPELKARLAKYPRPRHDYLHRVTCSMVADGHRTLWCLLQAGFPGHSQQLQPPQVLGQRGEERNASEELRRRKLGRARLLEDYIRGMEECSKEEGVP